MVKDMQPEKGAPDRGDSDGELPLPVREALDDLTFVAGVREAMADTAPPVPLRRLREREQAERSRRV
jgi:hypothetical protein